MPNQPSPAKSKRYLTSRDVCERYSVTQKTLWMWMNNPSLNFPKPIRKNGRHYFDEQLLDEHDLVEC